MVSLSGANGQVAADSLAVRPVPKYDLVADPLRPVDATSPRATLISFQTNMSRSYQLLMEAHVENLAAGGLFTPAEVAEKGELAEAFLARAIKCLDMSQVPPSFKKEMGYESALDLQGDPRPD